MIHNYAPTPHTDGSLVYAMPDDQRRKMVAANYLSQVWGMQMHPMPPLGYTDFLCARHGRPVCWLVIISRSYSWDHLSELGGVFLKRRTWNTLRQLALVPLSIDWRGAYVAYDLAGELYCQNIANVPDHRAVAWDPRGAAHDTEPAVLVTWLERIG